MKMSNDSITAHNSFILKSIYKLYNFTYKPRGMLEKYLALQYFLGQETAFPPVILKSLMCTGLKCL